MEDLEFYGMNIIALSMFVQATLGTWQITLAIASVFVLLTVAYEIAVRHCTKGK